MPEPALVPDPSATIPHKRIEGSATPISLEDALRPERRPAAKTAPRQGLHPASLILGFLIGFLLATCTTGTLFLLVYLLA